MPASVKRLQIETTQLGHCPYWYQPTKSLYYVDLIDNSIHRYQPSIDKHTKAKIIDADCVSLIIPVEAQEDCFVITTGKEIVKIRWDGEGDFVEIVEKLWQIESDDVNVRLNNGKCDATGRLWAGTMALNLQNGHIDSKKCALYSFESNRQIVEHVSQISLSNGMAWSLNYKRFYFIDSRTYTIDKFDFDLNTTTLSNRKTIFTLDKHNIPGLPYGMTIDSDGNLWIAIFCGNRIIKIDPNKPEQLLDTILLPATQVTSVAFGGAELDELYVTTSNYSINSLPPPDHGAIYRITDCGVKGLPSVPIKL